MIRMGSSTIRQEEPRFRFKFFAIIHSHRRLSIVHSIFFFSQTLRTPDFKRFTQVKIYNIILLGPEERKSRSMLPAGGLRKNGNLGNGFG